MKFSWKLSRSALLATVMVGAGFASAHATDISGSTVAFLMPDQGSTRYEQHDHPGFVAEMTKLCAMSGSFIEGDILAGSGSAWRQSA